jgi:hypothetical protein
MSRPGTVRGATTPGTIEPSGAIPVWPARKTVRPWPTTAWLKPDGTASEGGFTRSITTALLPRRR